MELTEWVYEFDRIFHWYEKWEGVCFVTNEELQNHYKRILVDSEGNVLTITHHEILKQNLEKTFLFTPTYKVKLTIERTGERISLEELKQLVISKSEDHFHIKGSQLLAKDAFSKKVEKAKNIKELIFVAAFVEQ